MSVRHARSWARAVTHSIATNPPWMKAALTRCVNAYGASQTLPIGWIRRPRMRSSSFATDFPAYGQARTSNELRKCGIFVSACGVRSIWLRHDLANFKTRLKALEAIVAEKGGILTEAQVQALEKKKHDDNEIPVLVGNFVGGFLLTGLPLMYLHTTSQQTKVAI